MRRREAGWRATGGELAVRRITNLIRLGVRDELADVQRSLEITRHAAVVAVSDVGAASSVWGRNVGKVWRGKRGELSAEGERCTAVRAFVVPQVAKSRLSYEPDAMVKRGLAKPRTGKGGRKVEAGGTG